MEPGDAPKGGKSLRKDLGNSSEGLLLLRVYVELKSLSTALFKEVLGSSFGCGVLTMDCDDLSLCSEKSSSFLNGDLKSKIQYFSVCSNMY